MPICSFRTFLSTCVVISHKQTIMISRDSDLGVRYSEELGDYIYMRIVKIVLPVALTMGALMFWSTSSFGKPEYAKKESQKCAYCHSKMATPDAMKKDPNLTDAGKYYAAHNHSLDGYKPPAK